ncbi:MAG: L-serine ammonia-lyase [Saprospiraceae bacterium]|nr:L-serine ammonia-lyase [Saprospiraceae bacterium]
MERISIFDIYKIGVGPSSSHTLGPWKAALDFTKKLAHKSFDTIDIHLFGSLSKTGVGHGTDIAVQLGLAGYNPVTIPTEEIGFYVQQIDSLKTLSVNETSIKFDPSENIIFHGVSLPEHPNTLIFKAYAYEALVLETTYYSVGGGFIEEKGMESVDHRERILPYPIDLGQDLLDYTTANQVSISEIVHQNELQFQSEDEIVERIEQIYNTMVECVYKGCNSEGVLPGGLNVKRRAKKICQSLLKDESYSNAKEWMEAIRRQPNDFNTINKWISCFALAVNEENASLGRVVTSPTNGAAGVIPAVLLYYYFFCDYQGKEDLQKFMYTSGEIGCIFKKGATISAAVGGCQAEIGVSSAMAAGGLTELLGGTPQQVLMAAEIAMEHHLGLTCDPIGGLVQIPCIERNTMGAMKAITASNLALTGNPHDAIVGFDLVVKTMWDTAQDMNGKYKETAEGGLAFNLPVAFPSC